MADPPPADTPAASTRDRNVVADTLAVDRSSASPADAVAELFSSDWEQAGWHLAATIPSPAREFASFAAPRPPVLLSLFLAVCRHGGPAARRHARHVHARP